MATYAVLDNSNVVINIIAADTKKIAEEVTNCLCVAYTDKNPAQIGWVYNGKSFEAIEATPE